MAKNTGVADVDIDGIAKLTDDELLMIEPKVSEPRMTVQAQPKNEIDIEAIARVSAAEIERSTASRQSRMSPQVQTVVRVENNFGAMTLLKYKGQTPSPIASRSKTYWAKAKQLSFYMDENTLIQFNNNCFVTDMEDIIDFLEGHPAFRVHFWKDKLPEDIIKIRKHDQAFITPIKGEYN
jgi:hypothetical protein